MNTQPASLAEERHLPEIDAVRDALRAFAFDEQFGADQVAANSKEDSYPEKSKVFCQAASSRTMAQQYQTDGNSPPAI